MQERDGLGVRDSGYESARPRERPRVSITRSQAHPPVARELAHDDDDLDLGTDPDLSSSSHSGSEARARPTPEAMQRQHAICRRLAFEWGYHGPELTVGQFGVELVELVLQTLELMRQDNMLPRLRNPGAYVRICIENAAAGDLRWFEGVTSAEPHPATATPAPDRAEQYRSLAARYQGRGPMFERMRAQGVDHGKSTDSTGGDAQMPRSGLS